MNCGIVTLPPWLRRHPLLQQPEEVRVADLRPQRVQGHRAAEVDGELEQQVRAGVADDHRPERVVGRDRREVVEELLRACARPSLLAPEPLGVGGEALVEPDVLPRGERRASRRSTGGRARGRRRSRAASSSRVLEEHARVDRARLVLEGEADAVGVVDDAAGGAERVRAEQAGEEARICGCCASAPRAISPVVGGVSAVVPTVQSAGFGSEPPGGPGTVQPSITLPSRSKDVVPWPPGPTMSSISTPP